MGAPERRPLRSSKNQIDGVLSRYLFTHIVKYRVIILKKVAHVARKKRIPDFYRTYCPRFELVYLTKLDYRKWE